MASDWRSILRQHLDNAQAAPVSELADLHIKVYAVEIGDYEERSTYSIHFTLEAAKAAYPTVQWQEPDGYGKQWHGEIDAREHFLDERSSIEIRDYELS